MSSQKLTEKLSKIDELVDWFNSEEIDLDEALAKFEELADLANSAKQDLADLENKITVLKQNFSQE